MYAPDTDSKLDDRSPSTTRRQMAPNYTYRLSSDDIRAIYGGSAAQAFADGNFMVAARLADANSELKGAALVLSGLLQEGLAILDKSDCLGAEGTLCRAFALWSLDRDAEAKVMLTGATDEKSRQFRALLERNGLTVFLTGAFLSIFPEQNTGSIMEPVHRYGPITAKYVGSQMAKNAYGYELGEPLDEFIAALPSAERPDFIFALSPLWLIANNFHKVAVPKVLWCHDTDVFLYRYVENFALYDVGICSCAQEHLELTRGTGLFCATNMMSNPLNMPFPEAQAVREKKFDVVFTGSSLSPFHTEKSRFAYKLAELGERYRIRIVEGYLPEEQYFELLSQSKFLPIVNRYADAPSPRWRDALTNGAGLLAPEGTLFDEIPGCFAYRADHLAADIGKHIQKFDTGASGYDLTGMVASVNARFAIYRLPREKMFERLLKYAAFMALIWRDRTTVEKQQRRLTWLSPCIDPVIFGRDNVCTRIADLADAAKDETPVDDQDHNNIAHVFAQLALTFTENPRVTEWARHADFHFKKGLEAFPNSLLLRFNCAYWNFMRRDADYLAAAMEFGEIVAYFDRFDFDYAGSDIGFGYTMPEHDLVFPYYEYGDLVTRMLLRAGTTQLAHRHPAPEHDPRDIVLSACHGFMGWARLKAGDRSAALACFERGLAVFPQQFPMRRLYLETLLQHCAEMESLDRVEVGRLTDAIFAAANIYPALLLTHIFAIVPLLVGGGEIAAARDLLAAWYRLANVVHFARPENVPQRHTSNLALLLHHWPLLPVRLQERIEACCDGRLNRENLTQIEQLMMDVKSGRTTTTPARSYTVASAAIIDYATQGRGLPFRALARAFRNWMRLTSDARWLYVRKAYAALRHGSLTEAADQIRRWNAARSLAQPRDQTALPRQVDRTLKRTSADSSKGMPRVRSAFRDLRDGVQRSWLWSAMAVQDIALRYRGSYLGPFWLTISIGIMVGAMGTIYPFLFHMDMRTYLAYLTIGLVVWQFISSVVNEGCQTFLATSSVILQNPMPFSIHAYRLVCRNLIVLMHNAVIIPLVLLIYPVGIGWSALWIVPGLVLLTVNSVSISLLLGMLSARFRDVPPIVANFIQVLFFVTPIFWSVPVELGQWRTVIEINPLFAAVDVIRAPLLGMPAAPHSWTVLLVTTLVGAIVSFGFFARFRGRIAYWI